MSCPHGSLVATSRRLQHLHHSVRWPQGVRGLRRRSVKRNRRRTLPLCRRTPANSLKGSIGGTGTSAYQIEGAWKEDDKGESVWDRYAHTPGNTKNNDTGDVANDHYHRYKEDIALMKGELGVTHTDSRSPGHESFPRAAASRTQRASTFTSASWTNYAQQGLSRSRHSTTGICRKRSTTNIVAGSLRRQRRHL